MLKSIFKNTFALFVFSILTFAAVALAQDVVAPPEGFEWVSMVMQFLLNIPHVGPVLVKAIEIIAAVSIVMTSLSAGLIMFVKLSAGAAKLVGAHDAAEKIVAKSEKVLYWLKYLSMFNAKK